VCSDFALPLGSVTNGNGVVQKLETEALGLATFFKGGRHFPHLLHDRNGYDGASHIVSIDESGRLIKSFAYDTRDRLAGDGTLRRKYYNATSII
jgi:hypothetical protein